MKAPTLVLHPTFGQSETPTHLFFYGGVYSQWAHSPFKARLLDIGQNLPTNLIEFSSTEQWMMAHKAILFGDLDSLYVILGTDDPAKQKAQGKKVKGYDEKKWAAISRTVVTLGNVYKFRQNPHLFGQLEADRHLILVEASKYDPRWGIGLHYDDPKIVDPANWKGTNWLGECLMAARDMLL